MNRMEEFVSYNNQKVMDEYGYSQALLEEWVQPDAPLRKRIILARLHYGLDRLVNDPSSEVRKIVAEEGFGLDKLTRDDDPDVVDTVNTYMTNLHEPYAMWVQRHPYRCVIEKNIEAGVYDTNFVFHKPPFDPETDL